MKCAYGHRLGYVRFNAGAVIKVRSEARSVTQRIISEVEMLAIFTWCNRSIQPGTLEADCHLERNQGLRRG
jgi:hypothetical protein